MSFMVPASLVFENSRIIISYNTSNKLNSTNTAIVISGNENGFLSLSNSLIYASNMLEEQIRLEELPFVKSSSKVHIIIDDDIKNVHGYIIKINENEFEWLLSEVNMDVVSSAIHSLGYVNKELHFDSGMDESETSVYCVVD